MRYRLVAVLAALCCLLCGCSGWLDNSYVSVTPHQERLDHRGQVIVQASNYSELQTALSDMVDSGQESGVILVKDYEPVMLPTDLEFAMRYIQERYPIGAYALKSAQYEMGSSGGQEAVAVTMTYAHDYAQISQIQTVRGAADMRSAITAALDQFSTELVLQVFRYEETDIAELVESHAAQYPERIMEIPNTAATVYPKEGSSRVIELKFTYEHSRDELRIMQGEVERVFSAAELYVMPGAAQEVRYDQLYGFLMERFSYQFESSATPPYSLLCAGVGDCRAFATVYAALCRRSGLECQVVNGTRNGEPWCWNIIRRAEGYAHLDLWQSYDSSGIEMHSDDEMTDYEWDRAAYPACQPPSEIGSGDTEGGN